jgi:hypothetical protein
MAFGAGIVDCHIEPPEALNGFIDQVAHLAVMPNVGADEFGLCADRAELSDKLGARVAVAAGDDDLVAFIGEGQGRGTADPGERAGNQDNGHLTLLVSLF